MAFILAVVGYSAIMNARYRKIALIVGFGVELFLIPFAFLQHDSSGPASTQRFGAAIADLVCTPPAAHPPGHALDLLCLLLVVSINGTLFSLAVFLAIQFTGFLTGWTVTERKHIPARTFTAGNTAVHATDAREWMTAVLMSLVEPNDQSSLNTLTIEFDEVFKLFSGADAAEIVNDAQSRALHDVHQQVRRARDLGLLSLGCSSNESPEWQRVRDLALVALQRFNLSAS